MRGLVLLGVLSLGVACGPTPRVFCEEVGRMMCERTLACSEGAALDAFVEKYGDAESCAADFRRRVGCEQQTELTYCPSSEWNSANAQACLQELSGVSCQDFMTTWPTCKHPCDP